jgi:hypothetical protein
LNSNKIQIYDDVLGMLKSNPKMRLQKYLISSSRYNIFSANVLDFYSYFTAKYFEWPVWIWVQHFIR